MRLPPFDFFPILPLSAGIADMKGPSVCQLEIMVMARHGEHEFRMLVKASHHFCHTCIQTIEGSALDWLALGQMEGPWSVCSVGRQSSLRGAVSSWWAAMSDLLLLIQNLDQEVSSRRFERRYLIRHLLHSGVLYLMQN